MKYFIDTEFHEGFYKALMKPKRHFIDLISIGIVCEDGREYYAINKEFDVYAAWNKCEIKVNLDFKPQESEGEYNPMYIKEYWLRDNVLKPIYWELIKIEEPILCHAEYVYNFNYNEFKRLIKKYGKTNKQIAEEIKEFIYINEYKKSRNIFSHNITIGKYISEDRILFNNHTEKCHPCGNVSDFDNIEFYGYYSDYDWVVFCSLFGTMINLPKGFPMYCIDLKQTLDEKEKSFIKVQKSDITNYKQGGKLMDLKDSEFYPKQENEHNALADAKWNYELYKFLTQ